MSGYRNVEKKAILIIDDNAINREILSELISDEYDCIEAENGQEGLNILRERGGKVSAILLDLIMPVCSGTEFLQIISRQPYLSSIPVIVMTSETSEEVQRQCLTLGALEFLSKNANPSLMKVRLRNIINLKESASLIGEMKIDELTGLYSRQAFYYFAKEMLKNNLDTDFDVMMLDIQDFKIINNIYGEEKGDELLKAIGVFIKSNAANGVYARFDSDRFVCIVPVPEEPYRQWMDAKLSSFEECSPVRRAVLKCGIYEQVDRSITVREMCDRANLALNSIKSDYSRKFAFYDGPVSQQQLREKRFGLDFQEAIKRHEFVMWYQPKMNPYTGKIVAAEALVRWKKTSGYVSPGEFIGVFEDNGQIVELDEYVFRSVCMQQKKWIDKDIEIFPISINLSRKSMSRLDLVRTYKKIVEETGVPIDAVPIEITESASVRSAMIRPVVEELHAAGFAVHLDDFGSGQSSVNALSVLDIDVVKIDKSLVDNIGDERGNIILESTMSLAEKLGIHIVAEGVEKKEQLDFLMKNHVNEIQGYYYSKPLPPEEFEYFAKENIDGRLQL